MKTKYCHAHSYQISRIKSKLVISTIVILLISSAITVTTSSIVSSNAFNPSESSIVFTVHFTKPVIEKVGESHLDRVTIDGLESCREPGKPIIPMKTVRLLLPQNTDVRNVNINVLPGPKVYLGADFKLEYGKRQIPLSTKDTLNIKDAPNETIYNSAEPYPKSSISNLGVQKFRGYSVLILNIYPVEYIPQSGELYYFGKVDIKVNTVIKSNILEPMFRGLQKDQDEVTGKVDNLDMAPQYKLPTNIVSRGVRSALVTPGSYDYVIITNNALNASTGTYKFQDLMNFKNNKGVKTTIVTTERILAEPAYWGPIPLFNDTQAIIRNFIKDAYLNWGIGYVLLGGDGDGSSVGGESGNNIIPARGFYCSGGGETDSNIPADLYYACLDGNFNNNQDSYWAEPTDGIGGGEVDLMAEVYVGRAPVDSIQELSNFVMKTLWYENIANSSYIKTVWMAGEKLWDEPYPDGTWGKDYKEEVRNGSSTNGHVTVGIPQGAGPNAYNVSTLYDKDYPGNSWPKSVIVGIINNGTHIINHLGHANVNYVMKFYNSDADTLTNDEYFFGYSQGCYPGAFDDRDSYGSYTTYDSICEHLVCNPTGAFAFIGNSRYGWAEPGTTNGSSQYFDREFFDALFGENIRNIGKANQDSKEDSINVINWDTWRWCYYEINLFGDPELSIKDPILPEHDVTVVSLEVNNYLLSNESAYVNGTVKNQGKSNETNVLVNLTVNGSVVDTKVITFIKNGSAQTVSFNWTPTSEGIYDVAINITPVPNENVTTNNWLNKTVIVGPELAVTTLTISPYPKPNETVFVNATVENLGRSDEVGIVVNLKVNGTIKNTTTIEFLAHESQQVVIFRWFPQLEGAYNVEAEAVPNPKEPNKENNRLNKTATVRALPPILLVDDESGTDETYYKAALDANSYKYDYVAGPTQSTGWAGFLMQYKIIVWFISGSSDTLTSTDQQNIATFLDGGGKLLVCGEDIGYNIGTSGVGESGFIANYLHADYIADDTNIANLDGVSGDPISNGFTNIPNIGSYPSEIALYDSYASKIFTYTGTTKIAALKADTSVYKVVYFACEYFEGTDSSANKATVMDRTMKWFAPVNDVSVNSIDYPADGGKYQSGTRYVNATVVNNGKNAQSNFNVNCKIEEVKQKGETTTILSENFDKSGSVPTGWDISTYTGRQWEMTNENSRYGSIVNGADYGAVCDSDRAGSGVDVASWLKSPAINCAAYSSITLEFYHKYNWYGETSTEGAYTYLSIDGGSTWPYEIMHYYTADVEELKTIDISSYAAGKSNVKLGWKYVANYDYWWVVDDVTVKSTTPTVTQIVSNTNQTVTASLAQYATAQVSWTYNFQNATDYIITVKTWLSTDESKGNDAESITITIALMFAFSFEQGWNFVTLPLNTTYKTAGELANAIPYCQYIKKWDSATQSYIIYEKGIAINNFSLESGIGYFVFVTQTTDFTIDGSSFSKQTLTLGKGWNSIGRFNETVIKASDLAKDIGGNCTVISYWDETLQRFVMHLVGTSIGDFNIERGKGYFAYMSATTVWNNK